MKPPTICSPRFWPTAFSTWRTSSGSSSNGPRPDPHGFSMNEFELIARLTESLETNDNTVVGVGDDCAVLDFGVPDRYLLFKTDAVVEGVHFTPATDPK